jgi:hypothetical protein
VGCERNSAVKWRTAAYAGLAAGVLAALLEVVLWFIFSNALPEIFFRDARFAAAIVMGPQVLSRPPGFDWPVMLAATLLHFALSLAYGVILSYLIRRLRTLSSLLAGAAFGLFLYAINMYGFTIVFTWFEDTRDWITIAAHVAFGITAAATYRMLTK